MQSICELTFCAASCTTRHLVSFDMNKSYRPGFLVLVSYIKCLICMCNSCTHLSTVSKIHHYLPKYRKSGNFHVSIFWPIKF